MLLQQVWFQPVNDSSNNLTCLLVSCIKAKAAAEASIDRTNSAEEQPLRFFFTSLTRFCQLPEQQEGGGAEVPGRRDLGPELPLRSNDRRESGQAR